MRTVVKLSLALVIRVCCLFLYDNLPIHFKSQTVTLLRIHLFKVDNKRNAMRCMHGRAHTMEF